MRVKKLFDASFFDFFEKVGEKYQKSREKRLQVGKEA